MIEAEALLSSETGSHTGSLFLLHGPPHRVHGLEWSPDGRRLAAAHESGALRIGESRLEDAQPSWTANWAPERAAGVVHGLFEQHVFLAPVIVALHEATTLPSDVRELALRMARARGNPRAPAIDRRIRDLMAPGASSHDRGNAVRIARIVVEQASGVPQLRTLLADALFATGAHDDAVGEAERALELAPASARPRFQDFLEQLEATVLEARAEGERRGR